MLDTAAHEDDGTAGAEDRDTAAAEDRDTPGEESRGDGADEGCPSPAAAMTAAISKHAAPDPDREMVPVHE